MSGSGTRVPTVVGIGNLLLRDDGAGVRAAEMLRSLAPEEVRVLDGGVMGLELLATVEEASRLMVLDSIDSGRAPGTVLRLSDPPGAASGKLSPHQVTFADAVGLARLRGTAPEEIVVLGIQPARVEPGLELSPEVAAALPHLVDEALAILSGWVAADSQDGAAGPGRSSREAG
ncbi:MAG: HyaD/HybD family hydrogenase maturation endopeptidase [Acidobacteria bacterium]|nr:HyaD/HybD family hydrogenase maturation endopeptidase [Acidobacteriota bacterium]